MRAVIADAGLEGDAAVGLDDEQTVEANRSGGERADRDADAAGLGALTLAAVQRLLLVPLEELAPFVERFLDERARDVVLLAVRERRPERRLAGRRVDPAHVDLIEAEHSGGL